MTLRPATHADVDAVSSMQKASLLETYEPFLGRAAIEEFIAGGHVEGYFEEHWHQATIAVSGDEIVGVAVLAGSLLDLIWVRPDSRSEGIGSALMDAAERQAAAETGVLTSRSGTTTGEPWRSTSVEASPCARPPRIRRRAS